jgi:hypothetical protein
MAKLGKKYLDKSGLSYLWKKIDGRFVHIKDGETSFEDGEIIVGIAGENGVTGSGITIGGATLSENPTASVVATELAVHEKYKDIIDKIEDLGAVMSFLGVTPNMPTVAEVVIGIDEHGKDIKVTATVGDVVVYGGPDKPTEYVWNGSSWQEIGRVFNDEAITSVTSGSNAIEVNTTDGTSTVSLKIDDDAHTAGTEAWTAADSGYGHIHLSQEGEAGLKAEYGREVLTIGDALDGDDIDDAISKASSISWKDGAWVGADSDFQ